MTLRDAPRRLWRPYGTGPLPTTPACRGASAGISSGRSAAERLAV